MSARWGQRLLLAGGILAFCPGLPEPYYTVKSLCCAGGVAWAWLAAPRARRAPLTAPIVALLAVAVASAVLGADPPQSFWGDALQPYYGLLPLSLYALVYFCSASAEPALLEDGLWTLALAAGLCGVLAAAQAAGLVEEPWGLMGGRALGPTGNPVFFGALAAALLPAALSRARGSRLGQAAAALVVVALLAARARGAWLGAAAGTASWLAASRLPARGGRRALAALAAAAVAGALWLGGPSKRAGDALRLETWRAGAAAVRERPLLGFGPDLFMLAYRRHQSEAAAALSHETGQGQTSAHDDLLQAAATLGLTGLAAYLWLLAAAAAATARGLSLSGASRETASAAGAGLLALFVAAKFNPVPLEGCVVAAWLAGAAAARGPEAAPWARPALRAASLAVLAAFLCLAGAESAAASARRALLSGRFDLALTRARLAAGLAPGRLGFEERLGETLATVARYDPARAEAARGEGLALGRRAAAAHPGDPTALELAGAMAQLAGEASNDRALLLEARGYLERAERLSPLHTFAARKLVELARRLGDAPAEARESERLRRLSQLNGETP